MVLEALLLLAELLLAAADRLGAVAQALLQLVDLGQPLGVGRPVAGLRLLRFLVCPTPRHARSTVNDFGAKPHRAIEALLWRQLAESGARRVVERRQLELDDVPDSIVRRDRRVPQALDQRARD